MTREEAKAVSKIPIVDQIGPSDLVKIVNDGPGPQNFMRDPQPSIQRQRKRQAVPDEEQVGRPQAPDYDVVYQAQSPLHLRMVSIARNKIVRDFSPDDKTTNFRSTHLEAGGSFIYVLDKGFDFDHQVLTRGFAVDIYEFLR